MNHSKNLGSCKRHGATYPLKIEGKSGDVSVTHDGARSGVSSSFGCPGGPKS